MGNQIGSGIGRYLINVSSMEQPAVVDQWRFTQRISGVVLKDPSAHFRLSYHFIIEIMLYRKVTRRGIGRLARRSLVAAALTAIQAVIHFRFLRFPCFSFNAKKIQRGTRFCVSLYFLLVTRTMQRPNYLPYFQFLQL